MKKGAIFGIVAAFVIIAMLIFLPVIINNAKAPSETVSTDVIGTGEESTAASSAEPVTEPTVTEPDVLTDTQTEEETEEQTTEAETDTEEDTSEPVTETEEETTEPEETTAETTEPEETTAKEETTAEPEPTTEETTKEPETTAEPLPITTAEVKPLDPEKKYVAFTFDDGPDAKRSKLITDKMLEYGGKCTFFVIGTNIYGDREKSMKYAFDHGMEIQIHCWTHKYYYTKDDCTAQIYHDEVYKTADKLHEVLGVWPTLMRPPGGNITEAQYKSSEFPVIIWSIDTNDWRYKRHDSDSESDIQKSINTIVNNALYDDKGNFNVKNGDIILMHEIYENSYDAFCIIIEELHNRGFEFVTVSELLQNPETGYKYYSATYKKG